MVEYWSTRWRPLVWTAAYSVQFELGPLSEASIGNVGLTSTDIGWVDYVVTPVGGLGLMTAEDAIDQFFIAWFEGHVRNRPARVVMRTLFNTSAAHAMRQSCRRPLRTSVPPRSAGPPASLATKSSAGW